MNNDRVTLVLQPGVRVVEDGPPVHVGVPYGSRARLILLYLQSEALRTGSREIELSRSLHAWLRRLSISIGGMSMRDVRDQAERISRCRMSFEIKQGVSFPVCGGKAMGWLFEDGLVAPLLLGFVLAEAVLLLLLHRRTGRGLPPGDIIALLAPGACLMLALWAAMARAWWGWIGLALSAALVAHLVDLRRRWSGR